MTSDGWFDPAALFGARVIGVDGRSLGRVVAAIHRRDGCDLLLETRRLLRRSVRRVDLADIELIDGHTVRYIPGARRSGDRGDWSVA